MGLELGKVTWKDSSLLSDGILAAWNELMFKVSVART